MTCQEHQFRVPWCVVCVTPEQNGTAEEVVLLCPRCDLEPVIQDIDLCALCVHEENKFLRDIIKSAYEELYNVHHADWDSQEAHAGGRWPSGCTTCLPSDKNWPCVSAEVADDLYFSVNTPED